MRFDLTRSAQSDLKAIARFTQERWGVRQRNAYLKEMDRVFRSLARNPSIGRGWDEMREGERELPEVAHEIDYRHSSENGLSSYRILHATMDVDSNIGA